MHNTHKDLCYRDNLPAVDVKTWYLHAHMFDGDAAAGPVPILFAANPEAAAAAIEAEPAKAHFDLSKVSYYTRSLKDLTNAYISYSNLYVSHLLCSGVAHISAA
jgi:hypothetical protein